MVFSAGFAGNGRRGSPDAGPPRRGRVLDRHESRRSQLSRRLQLRARPYATFSTTLEDGYPTPGGVALVSQSGAYGSHLSLLARKRNIDIRYWVTTGNEVDVTVPEVLGWMAEQDDVSVIMAHAEGVTDRDALLRALATARAPREARWWSRRWA